MSKFSKDILQKIEKDDVSITSKHYYRCKEGMLWFGIALVTIAGSVALGLFLQEFFGGRARLSRELGTGIVGGLSIPVLAILLSTLVVMIALLYIQQRNTDHGFRTPILIVLGGGVVAMGVMGGALFMIKGEDVEHFTNNQFSPYNHEIIKIYHKAHNPKQGRVVGKVISVNDTMFTIVDGREESWEVEYSDESERSIQESDCIAIRGEWSPEAQKLIAKNIMIMSQFTQGKAHIFCEIVPVAPRGERKPEGMRSNILKPQ